jgi:hypothetical protein
MIRAELGGKAALVTGAASGIGLATAEAFLRSGAAVALNHLPDDPRGAKEVERLRALGHRVIAAPGDVSRPGAAERMVGEAIAALGRLDFLANNAGTPATPTPISRRCPRISGRGSSRPIWSARSAALAPRRGRCGRRAAPSATPPRSPASWVRGAASPMRRARQASST